MVKATRYNNTNRMCLGVRRGIRYGDVFVKEKESDFVQVRLLLSGKENKRLTNMDIENYQRFVNKGIFGKEFYMCLGLDKTGMI